MAGLADTVLKKRNGQSLVEFALILPLLVFIVAGIFDLGRAFFSSITITNAAREGARYGSLWPNDQAGMRSIAAQEANNSGITINPDDIVITCPDIDGKPGCDRFKAVKVTVNYLYDDMILKFFFPSGINMHRAVEMLVP